MTSILSTPGKYRNRKDISAGSIPKLVALEEESNGTTVLTLNSNGIVMINSKDTANGVNGVNDNSTPVKPPRRSSIGILGGRNANTNAQDGKTNKRRSSIATFLGGRRESKTSHNHTINTIHEKYSKNSESDDENETPNDQNGQIKDNGYAIDDGYDKKRRRSSWQAKLERRRRKGMTSALDTETRLQYSGASISGIKYEREKRHSWWNIFVPENLKQRTRRASQDAILSQNSDNLTPYRRSKSRSVDHGLAAPFDLDSLRSKVEGRFESIDRLSKDGEKKRSLTTIPTASYTVGDRDTLTSVAARFDTTPSELSHLNRLNSSFIYSGQVILVPDKSSRESGSEIGDGESSERSSNSPTAGHRQHESHEDLTLDEKNLLEGLRPVSPKPGHIERVSSPNNQSGGGGGTSAGDAGGTNEDDPVIIQRFLKINVRHITDGQGVVGGVLLVTPNAVMFDPNVSDPLVIEHGPECYGVIAPMEFIVNAAIFNDIAHMRVNGATGNNTTEKAEVYHPPSKACSRSDTHSPGKDSLLVKDETFPELGIEVAGEVCDDQESIASSNEREGAAFPKAFDRDLVTPNNMQQRLQGGDSLESAASFDKPSSPYMSCETPNSLDGGVPDSKAKDKSEKATTKTDDHSTDNKTNNTLNSDSKTLEERRRSLLDHHWAIPSKDSSMDEKEAEEMAEKSMPVAEEAVAAIEDGGYLVKLECHDSGIDIRDPVIPVVQPTHAKKIYSDADIVLSSEWVPPLTIPSHIHGSEGSPKSTFLSSSLAMGTSTTESSQRKKNSSVSFSVEEHEPTQVTVEKGGENKKNKMLKRLSYPLAWVEGLTGESSGKSDSMDSAPNTGDSNQSVFSKVFSRRSSIGTFIRPHSSSSESGGPQSSSSSGVKKSAPKLDYRSMVSIDDMPTLFVSFDKLIPRPARACPDPPMYLRLRMGKPIGKTTPLPTTVMSYGKNKLRPEYWFSIPKNKVDELYRFLNAWVQHIYGELDEEAIAARGYDLIQCDTEFLNKSGSPNKDGRSASEGEITEYTRESWEVLSMSTDDYRKAALFTAGSFDQDFQIPELIGQTEILSEEHREKLCAHLPARAEGYSWTLVFSTSLHGFSLNSLYRKMHKLESPVLIVIEDTEHNVFGALTSCALHVSDLFYGTGESLLYKFNPTFKVFHWTGENLYFIKGNPESLAIGAGDGKFGLWLDGDLNQGRSQSCSTYSNEPLAPQEDFVIKTLECWAFV